MLTDRHQKYESVVTRVKQVKINRENRRSNKKTRHFLISFVTTLVRRGSIIEAVASPHMGLSDRDHHNGNNLSFVVDWETRHEPTEGSVVFRFRSWVDDVRGVIKTPRRLVPKG